MIHYSTVCRFLLLYSTVQTVQQASATTQEYDELCKDPNIRYPEKHMLSKGRPQGLYPGCFAKSHWGGKRIRDKWDMFCEIAPRQAKIYSEVPNCVRAILGIDVRKHTGSKFKVSDGDHRVPLPLLLALESLLMDRIHLGEEVTYDFASSVLIRLVNVWNEQLAQLFAEVGEQGTQVVKAHDELVVAGSSPDCALQEASASHFEVLRSSLHQCKISTNSESLRKPGCIQYAIMSALQYITEPTISKNVQ